jgi:hypothetical protein
MGNHKNLVKLVSPANKNKLDIIVVGQGFQDLPPPQHLQNWAIM